MFPKFVIFFVLLSGSSAARILAVFSFPSVSHQIVFRPLVNELVRRGHELTVITADPEYERGQTPDNLTEIDVHDVSYKIWKDEYGAAMKSKAVNDIYEQYKTYQESLLKILYKQIEINEVQKIIFQNVKNFDIVLVSAIFYQYLALKHVLNVPVILLSPIGLEDSWSYCFGIPRNPSLYPIVLTRRYRNLTKWETIKELYNRNKMLNLQYSFHAGDDIAIKELFGASVPSIADLTNDIDLAIFNTNLLWAIQRPYPKNMIFAESMQLSPHKELPKDLQTYLDTSKHGVIYISFGSKVNPSQLPSDKIEILLKVFSKLKYDVLFKWDQDKLPRQPENVKIFKWLPQSDVLRHENVLLFITQGGLQSTDEAIIAGVPMIGIPLWVDQWFNTENYVHHKIGLQLDINTLNEYILENAIKTVIEDESYRHNIVRLRSLLHDQPQHSVSRAAWGVEYVLKHAGAMHLHSPAANLNSREYYELDLVAFILLFLLALTIAVVLITNYTCKILYRAMLR